MFIFLIKLSQFNTLEVETPDDETPEDETHDDIATVEALDNGM